MILEVALLNVKPGMCSEFEAAFGAAEKIIPSLPGYLSHKIRKCVETPNQYILLVHWQTLESHTQGFRQSDAYPEWKRLLHHFYDPFPIVEHFEEPTRAQA